MQNSSAAEPMTTMNMTPLIDVLLVLIVMMLLTLPPVQNMFSIKTPHPNATVQAKPVINNLVVDFDGTLYWNDRIVDEQGLERELNRVAQSDQPNELHVWPNRLAKYRDVAAVMASAQRLGVKNIGLVGNEQFI